MPHNYSTSTLSQDYQGWLLVSKLRKQLLWRRTPQRFYCVLDGQQLYYYDNDEVCITRKHQENNQLNNMNDDRIPCTKHPLESLTSATTKSSPTLLHNDDLYSTSSLQQEPSNFYHDKLTCLILSWWQNQYKPKMTGSPTCQITINTIRSINGLNA